MLNSGAYRMWTALLIVSSLVTGLNSPSVAAPGGGNTAAGLAGVGAGAALGAGAGQAGGTTPTAAGGGGGGGSAPIEVQVMAYKGLSEIAADVAEITQRALCNPIPRAARTPQPAASTDSASPPSSAPVTSSTSAAPVDKRPTCTDADRGHVLIEEPNSSLQIALYHSVLGYHDEQERLSEQLTASFSLRATLSAAILTSAAGHDSAILTLSTTDNASIQNVQLSLEGDSPEDFLVDPMSCPVVSTDHPCQVSVKFNYSEDMQANHPFRANIKIATDTYRWNHAVGVVGIYAPPKKPIVIPPGVTEELIAPSGVNFLPPQSNAAPAAAPAGGTTTSGGGGGSTAQPLSLQYLSGVETALAGLKSNIAYSSAAAQPTTQSFEVLVANELLNRHINSYTATSPLQLQAAADSLSHDLGDMLRWGAQVDYWTTACKPAEVKPQPMQPNANDGPKTDPEPKDAQKPDDAKSQGATPNGGGSGPNDPGATQNPKPQKKTPKRQTPSTTQSPECKNPVVIANLATATQLIAAYTALLQNPSDGNGTPVMVDVLRGAVLAEKLNDGMSSLQLNVAATAGSTRTNAFFFVNLFYLPKPSYNAGVIATFELRDPDNELLKSGVRTAFYDYNKKWLGAKFDDHELNDRQHCQPTDTFCVERKREK
jgi:hypothetical protein